MFLTGMPPELALWLRIAVFNPVCPCWPPSEALSGLKLWLPEPAGLPVAHARVAGPEQERVPSLSGSAYPAQRPKWCKILRLFLLVAS